MVLLSCSKQISVLFLNVGYYHFHKHLSSSHTTSSLYPRHSENVSQQTKKQITNRDPPNTRCSSRDDHNDRTHGVALNGYQCRAAQILGAI